MTTVARPAPPAARSEARAVVELARRAARAYDRPTLVGLLDGAADRLDRPAVVVAVLGAFKAGKSSLVNGVIGVDACPVDVDVATAVPTVVRRGDPPGVIATWPDGTRTELTPDRAGEVILERPGRPLPALVELGVASPALTRGLTLVDVPGTGGLRSPHTAAALAALVTADAALFVTDAGGELMAAELDVVRTAVRRCGRVAVVHSRCDLHPRWRETAARDRELLVAAGLDLPQIAVSSALRARALTTRDRSVDREAGYPALIGWLADTVVAQAETAGVGAAARQVVTVADGLTAELVARREALVGGGAALAELDRARQAADRRRSVAARWPQTIGDVLGDLAVAADTDLRGRGRELLAAVDARLDDGDPATTWPAMAARLREDVAELITAHAGWLDAATDDAVVTVLAAFAAEDRPDRPDLPGTSPDPHRPELADPALDRPTRVGQAISVVRNGSLGFLVFGLLGGVAGLAVAAPVTAGLGLALGVRGLRDERARQRAARVAAARVAAHRYVDEVIAALGREARSRVRHVQRALRDHCTAAVADAQQVAARVLATAQQAADLDVAERRAAVADLDAELTRVAALRARAGALLERPA